MSMIDGGIVLILNYMRRKKFHLRLVNYSNGEQMALFDWRDPKRKKAEKAAAKKAREKERAKIAKEKATEEKMWANSRKVDKLYKKYQADCAKLGFGPDRMPFGVIDSRC